jgi:hypothetical protein
VTRTEQRTFNNYRIANSGAKMALDMRQGKSSEGFPCREPHLEGKNMN